MARTKTARMAANAAEDAPAVTSQHRVPTNGEILHRAYELYLARDCKDGRDVDDWLQAERELRSASNRATK